MKTYTVKEWLKKTFINEGFFTRPSALCKDGFSISIQGGTPHHYCKPLKYGLLAEELELGYPTNAIPELKKYSENDDCQGIFAYVPIKEVEEIIKQHGGIIGDEETGAWYFIFHK